jgi:hypothetical protein
MRALGRGYGALRQPEVPRDVPRLRVEVKRRDEWV